MATIIRDGKVIQTNMLNIPSNKQQSKVETMEGEIAEEIIKEVDGKVLGKNKYLIGKFLGKGGFARCYLGTSLPHKNQYALKVVSKDTLIKPSAKQKLQAEIRIHRNLRHANVVRFEKFFEDDNCSYILLELCKNNSMSEMLKRRKKLTEPEVRFYILQLTSALAYLHDAQIIHRDLKLGNIFLDSNMRVKVGDFGLATKLAYPEEKKRTVCGTPNYIAPEILAHSGHSFEVDIWSTGIIIYTLLVGRPPYETTTVKATYERIMANQYSFPPTSNISEAAQQLIKAILQIRPDRRPSLLDLESHPFFTSPGCYTPTALTSAAMREVPIQCLAVPEKNGQFQHATLTDENDPHAANRNWVSKPTIEKRLSPPRKQNAENQDDFNKNSAFHARRSASTSRTQGSGRLSGEYQKVPEEKNTVGVVTRSRKQTVVPLGTKPSNPVTLVHPALQAASNTERRGYVRQFEVYNENKPTRVNQQLHMSGDMVPKRSKTCERERRTSSSSNSSSDHLHQRPTSLRLAAQRYASDIPDEDTDTPENNSQEDALNEAGIEGNDTSNNQDNMEIANDDEEEGVQEIQHNMERHFKIKNSLVEPKTRGEDLLDEPEVGVPTAGGDPWALCDLEDDNPHDEVKRLSAPSAGYVTPTKAKGSIDRVLEYPDTLECMYQNLESSFHPSSAIGTEPLQSHDGQQPKIWVVKYVDYTSKYGMGFLLNTYSAGVYFNDSTKIILSPDGNIFQYIERRRRASTGVIEHLIHTHSLRSYPAELTKKVTLLKHFRTHLMGQLSPQQQQPHSTIDDQSTSWLNNYLDKTIVMQNDTPTLPYVKKWVRTRHAILFRLSNRTVQVVFFDNSEILLSHEAKIVTFLNKEGVRSLHRLDTIFSSGRNDVAKRIRYTKDIMARLITMQTTTRSDRS